jgi:NADPH:quinone reductase-like Zn-dependent oxidoreductase
MKAAVRDAYGSVEVREIDAPVVADGEVLVRVRASSVNAADWYAMMGRPYVGRIEMGLRTPKTNRLGTDFAGTVEAVGKDVTTFRPGDEVFGGKTGAYAEYVCVAEDRNVVQKPANVTFEQAACVGIAGLTALQGLRDKAQVRPGHKVLINGASGGVGTFSVQIAKALGAEVTGVCHTRNVELVRSLGADHVVDYTQEDFTRSDRRYDVLFDVAGSRSWSACTRVLTPKATFVMVGGPKSNALLGPIGHVVRLRAASLIGSRKAVFFIAKFNKPDIEELRELLESGRVTPAIEGQYGLGDIAEAFRLFGEGHARSKIVITM